MYRPRTKFTNPLILALLLVVAGALALLDPYRSLLVAARNDATHWMEAQAPRIAPALRTRMVVTSGLGITPIEDLHEALTPPPDNLLQSERDLLSRVRALGTIRKAEAFRILPGTWHVRIGEWQAIAREADDEASVLLENGQFGRAVARIDHLPRIYIERPVNRTFLEALQGTSWDAEYYALADSIIYTRTGMVRLTGTLLHYDLIVQPGAEEISATLLENAASSWWSRHGTPPRAIDASYDGILIVR